MKRPARGTNFSGARIHDAAMDRTRSTAGLNLRCARVRAIAFFGSGVPRRLSMIEQHETGAFSKPWTNSTCFVAACNRHDRAIEIQRRSRLQLLGILGRTNTAAY